MERMSCKQWSKERSLLEIKGTFDNNESLYPQEKYKYLSILTEVKGEIDTSIITVQHFNILSRETRNSKQKLSEESRRSQQTKQQLWPNLQI